jgi:hypothetical protein
MLLSLRRTGALAGGAVALALAVAPVPAVATPVAAPAAAAAACTPGVPPCVEIVQSLGADAAGGITPYAFAKGSDEQVWAARVDRDGDDRDVVAWERVGKPAGTTIHASVGADSGGLEDPYLFVRTADGALWMATKGGNGWTWTSHGRPAGVWLQGGYGVVAPQYGGRPHAFVKGNDGNLWSRSWSGSAWRWTNLGQPPTTGTRGIAGPGGAVVVHETRPNVFVRGNDGALWLVEWTGTAWRWSRQGSPTGVTVKAGYGATALNFTGRTAVVLGSDGNLWKRSWNGTSGAWTKIGQPGPIHSSAGVSSGPNYNELQVFVRGTDARIWRNRATQPDGWQSPQPIPGTGIGTAYGLVTFGYQEVQETMVFVKGGDKHLWVLSSRTSGNDWRWIDGRYPVR